MNRLTQVFDLIISESRRILHFSERNAKKFVLISIVVYVGVFSGYTVLMHHAFKTYAWDLGIFTQSLWTTVNTGQPFHYTIETYVNPSQNFFGAHFSPVLLLVVPVYAVFQSPITLLVLQSLILGLAALPVFWIARDKLGNELWGLTFAAAFLLHPAVHGINCFDFHVQAFIPLFFLLAFYYLDRKQWIKGITFALLTLSTIEFAPILILSLGFYLLVKAGLHLSKSILSSLKRLALPAFLSVISVFWFFAAFQVMYSINPLKSTGLPGNWDVWGRSMNEVVLNVLRNPLTALGVMANPIEKVYYVFSILVPVAFLPFLAPVELILVVPWLSMALLSEYPPYYENYFQYFGLIAGQVFIAAIYGAKRLFKIQDPSRQNPRQRTRSLSSTEKRLIVLILLMSLFSAITISSIGLPSLNRRGFELNAHIDMLHEVLDLIPANASVATQNDILPHLAQRENVVLLGWPRQSTADSLDVDFIIVDTKSSQFSYGAYLGFVPPHEALSAVLTMKSDKYRPVVWADGILLLEKGYKGELMIRPYEQVFSSASFFLDLTRSYIGFDSSSQSGRVIVYDTNHIGGRVWFGPYAYLYEGDYTATFRMKTKTVNVDFQIDVISMGDPSSYWKWTRRLNFTDFIALDHWQEFTLAFRVNGLQQWEFRGWAYSNDTYVALDYVGVTQVGP